MSGQGRKSQLRKKNEGNVEGESTVGSSPQGKSTVGSSPLSDFSLDDDGASIAKESPGQKKGELVAKEVAKSVAASSSGKVAALIRARILKANKEMAAPFFMAKSAASFNA